MDRIYRKLRMNRREFHLPSYEEIPDVGLFLEQTVRLVNSYFEGFAGFELTISMVSNYVKQKLIAAPVRKQYHREQIAYLIFMTVAKSMLSLEDVRKYIELQKKNYSIEMAYAYFREELENVLDYVYGNREELVQAGVTNTEVKGVLRNMIFVLAHKIFFDDYVKEVLWENEDTENEIKEKEAGLSE